MSELRATLPYFRPYLRPFALGMLLVVVTNAFSIARPWLMKLAIDGLEDPGVTMARISLLAGGIVVATFIAGAARFGMRQLLNSVSRRMEADLRNDFFQHLLRLDASFYGSTRTGDLMSRATNDTLAVRQAVGPAVMYTVNTAVGFSFALALMLWISPRLTLYAMIPMALLPPMVLGFGRIIHRRFTEIQEQFSTVSTMIQENLTGVRIVRAYTQEADQSRHFDALNREYRQRNMRLAYASGAFRPLMQAIAGVGMVVVLWLGGLEVMAGEITVGDFVAFGFYLMLLVWPMIALGWVVNLFQRGEASMGRINAILRTAPRVEVPEDPTPLDRPRGRVEFRDVTFRYPGTERPVLRGVSFVAEPGQTVALVGPTGSGKSTLIALLCRLYDADEGDVLVDGIPVRETDPAELRRAIGVVPQDAFLFSDTIEANIALGLDAETGPGLAGRVGAGAPGNRGTGGGAHRASRENGAGGDGGGPGEQDVSAAVEAAARIAQLHDQIRDFPRGYATQLGERGINLSGGQKQRATLARAVARDPAVLVLDDALSAVDTHTETAILADLREVMEGRTSFIISHRVSAVMHADQILVLEDGEIAERGTHEELLAREGTYARLLRRQLLEESLEGEEERVAAR